jgi:FlaA1/EpsC-like NDP-sugar epimerase
MRSDGKRMKPLLPHDELFAAVIGRTASLFSADVERRHDALKDAIAGSRILVIGGAGTIGGATIRALLPFGPDTLHVVDQNENGLAELIRDLRSDTAELPVRDLRTYPINFASSLMQRILSGADGRYDFILNFAALKHVRSEKDALSLLQMLNTNVAGAARLLNWISVSGTNTRYFCVSTDKAANPVSLMGASKRIMERVIFAGEPSLVKVTSARFANVAFSQGSLLESWLYRLMRQQPLATPTGVRRYFVSIKEAGHICLLAAFCAPERHLLIPSLDPESELQDLRTVAESVLAYYGYKARVYTDEKLAKANFSKDLGQGYYPLVHTPLDTSGEKPYEEFVGEGEQAIDVGFQTLKAIAGSQRGEGVSDFLKRLALLVDGGKTTSKAQIVEWMLEVVPQLRHSETGKSLDARM